VTEELAGRTALVTGAARGIGLAIATALIRQGAGVAVVDIDPRALETAVQSIGEGALAIQADVSQLADVQQAVELTVRHYGGLDILVNNAGICPLSGVDDISESEWDRVLAINLKGAFFCCQAALPHLRHSAQRGRIVNIASVAGQMGGITVGAHYAASKAGLIGISKSLAQILAADGVTVNCVAPGTTATGLTAGWAEAALARLATRIPLGRLAQPEEIAEAVCFLASDRAGFITGATLDLNGGLYLR
jgi:3-oxoacyl-[acyl-carrier protein] reductase